MAYRDLFKNNRTTNVNVADNGGGASRKKYSYDPTGSMKTKNLTDTGTGTQNKVQKYSNGAVYTNVYRKDDGTYASTRRYGYTDEDGNVIYDSNAGTDSSNDNGGGSGNYSKLAAIEEALKAQLKQYGLQKDQVNQAYDKLVNESELNRYKTRASIREALANRGQLDSGLGRQEQLYVDTQYGSALSNINTERANQLQNINNLIAEAKANAAAKRAKYK